MEAWNDTIKAALLGTDRNGWNESALPSEVKEVYLNVNVNENDREEKFLSAAALMMNYNKAGSLTPALSSKEFSKAGGDTRAACSRKAADLLMTTLSEGRRELTALWIETCSKQNKRIPHWLLPELLDLGAANPNLQENIIKIADARGLWLAQFNMAWKYARPVNVDETWNTGKPEERKQLLAHLRKNDPAKARELLASAWKQENANLRAEFVKLLHTGLSNEDVPFLEELLNDKSTKVKSEAKYLLRIIHGSAINNLAWEKLTQHIDLKKSLLGKKEIVLKKVSAEDKELMMAGAERESDTTVSLKDDERWFFHMISAIDPKRWEEYFKLDAKKIIGVFLNAKKTQKLLPAFSIAASRSQNTEWAKVLLDEKVMANSPMLLLLFPPRDREKIFMELMEEDISIVNSIFEDEPDHQWSLDFTRYVIKHSSADAYRFRREWYRITTMHFHNDIIKELDKYGPKDIAMRSFWQGISQEIVQTVELREAITHSLK